MVRSLGGRCKVVWQLAALLGLCAYPMPPRQTKLASVLPMRRPAALVAKRQARLASLLPMRRPAAFAAKRPGAGPEPRRSQLARPSAAVPAVSSSAAGASIPSGGYVRQLFDNQRVRVCDFRLPPGASAEHRSCFPTVRWQVDAAKHGLAADGESEVIGEVRDRQVFYVPAGSAWRLRNVGSDVYRQILFEIKQPPKHSEEEVQALLDSAIYSTDVGTELLFENHLCRVWDFYLEPGEGDPAENVHHHVMDYVFVYVARGRLLGYHHDGRPGLFDSVNDDNDVTWFNIPDSAAGNPKYAHGGKNGYDDQPMREYLVELK